MLREKEKNLPEAGKFSSLFNIGIDNLEDNYQPPTEETQTDAHEETLTRSDDFPTASTPIRVTGPNELTDSPSAGHSSQNFAILPRVANVPHWIKKSKDPNFKRDIVRTPPRTT